MGRCPRADHHPPEWVPSPRTGFPPGRRQQWDGRTQGNEWAGSCVRSGGLQLRRPEPRGPRSHGSHAPTGEEKSHRKPWTSSPSKLPAMRLRVALAPQRLQLGPEQARGHLRPRTWQASQDPLVDTRTHGIRHIPSNMPPCLPNPGQAALPSRHRQATIVNCFQLCHNLSSPRPATIPHTTTYKPQQPPGTSQETFLSCLQSRQDPHPQTWSSLYPLRTPLYLPADGPRQRGDSQLSREIPGDPGQPT